MKKKIKINKTKKTKYYAVYGKSDNFLYGVFAPSKEGLIEAKQYLLKLDPSTKNFKLVKF